MDRSKKKNLGLRIAGTIFAIVGLAHLGRLLIESDLILGSWSAPLWASGVAFFVACALSVWLFKLSND